MPQEYRLFLPIPGTQRRQADPRKTSKGLQKKPSKEIAGSVDRIQLIEKEIPSVAPPASPIVESSKEEEEALSTGAPTEAPSEDLPATSEESPAIVEDASTEAEAPTIETAPTDEEGAPGESEELSTITEEPTADDAPPSEAFAEGEPAAEAAEAPAEAAAD